MALPFSISKDKFKSETGKKLYLMLQDLDISEQFIFGIMAFASGDKSRQKMIDYIEQGIKDKTRLLLLAGLLNDYS